MCSHEGEKKYGGITTQVMWERGRERQDGNEGGRRICVKGVWRDRKIREGGRDGVDKGCITEARIQNRDCSKSASKPTMTRAVRLLNS